VGGLQRLAGGNVLVLLWRPEEESGQLVEFRPDHSIRAARPWPASWCDLRRLENGHFLTTLRQDGRVAEVDERGKEVWAVGNLKGPVSAQRLPSGHTLIAEYRAGRVVEMDRSGKVVWSHRTGEPWQAQRLADGHTLIADYEKVIKIDAWGKTIWERAEVGGALDLHAY
jgi:hypothetical protein